MIRFTLRRLLVMFPTLLVVSVIVFMFVRMIPGDPVLVRLGDLAADERLMERIRDMYHLNEPLPVQYLLWVGGFFTGDLGESIFNGQSVSEIVRSGLETTISLAGAAVVIALLLGIPTGILAAVRQGSPREYAILSCSFIGVSTPSFVLGILAILVFAYRLHLFPSMGYVSIARDPGEWAKHLVLPALTLGVIEAASVTRMMRTSLLDVLGRDYMVTARAKGVFDQLVIVRHAVPNALVPTITLVGMKFGYLLGGAAVLELVFALPGLGRVTVTAVQWRDYAVVQASLMLACTIFILVNLVTDLVCAYVDPRIKYGSRT